MDGSKGEKRGKSWRKEREEREKKKIVKQEQGSEGNPSRCQRGNSITNNFSTDEEGQKANNEVEGRDARLSAAEADQAALQQEAEWKQEEEERKKLEAEAAQKEEAQIEEDNRQYLLQYIQEAEERLTRKAELRAVNLGAVKDRPELNTALLDSNLKKNTAFIKKLKNITESQQDTLVRDMQSLNLSKYISEVAQAFTEAKLKMSDIETAVHLCSLLHQRYHDFAPTLLENWQRVLHIKKDEKIPNPSKLRVDLRFYAELITVGIFVAKEGLPLLGNLLTTLVNMDKEEHQNISILLTFCKHCGEDYMGLVPRKVHQFMEQFKMAVPRSDFLPAERQKNVRQLLKDYYNSLHKHMVKDHKELQKIEQHNRRILQTRGELSQERQELTENMAAQYMKLLSNTQQLAELLDEDMPNLPKDKSQMEEESCEVHHVEGEMGLDGSETNLWEDEDMKAFYENLPQLKALIPSILYRDSEKPTAPPTSEDTADTEDAENDDVEEPENGPEDDDDEEVLPPELPEDEITDDSLISGATASNKVLLEAFLSSLQNCINRDLIDSAAMEFCLKLNTKPNRKKLVKSLFLVSRTRLDLLPFYARLVATLQPLMPDVSTELCNMLKQDFKYQVKKKDQINIESKIKVVRFIGELVKFRMYPGNEALVGLKLLLNDFNHHHIEMACNLLETCGRFLYRSAETHHRTKIYLEQMMRKKQVKAYDPRYNTMIENAYFYVNPPDLGPDTAKKERPPMHEYIRKLLYNDLSKGNTEKILRQMRKLHWDNPEIAAYAVKCLTNVWNAKYYNIRCIANLLAGLISHYDWVGPLVVDGILEDIRLGMEVNHPKFNQRRVAAVKYLGELYNYRVIESAVVFKTLYSFITFGVTFDMEDFSEYDPPEHLFRIRLVCCLLETCGQFFNSGSSKRKLDCFIVYFQFYYWYKRSLPIWQEENEFPWQLEHLTKETMQTLRPKLQLNTSFPEAQKSLEQLQKQLVAKAIEQVPSLKEYFESESSTGLGSISEEGENEEEILQSKEMVDLADEEDDDLEPEMDMDMDWSETLDDNLTPSQHSQPSRNTQEEGERGCLTGELGSQEVEDDALIEGREEDEVLAREMQVSIKHEKSEEDDDFLAAFDQMVAENILERTRETTKPGQLDICVPVHVRSNAKKTYEQLMSENLEEEKVDQPIINFVLLTRSGNKQQFNQVGMPVDSELVTRLRTREEAERAEREKVKKMTLEINERQEEEDFQEMMMQAQRPATMNYNRDRRPKYQHPKGAPDADLIFGPKKIR